VKWLFANLEGLISLRNSPYCYYTHLCTERPDDWPSLQIKTHTFISYCYVTLRQHWQFMSTTAVITECSLIH